MKRLSGFTLLEVIFAVALFGLLMMAVASLWTACWKAMKQTSQAEATTSQADLVLKRLSEAVETAVYHEQPQALYSWKLKDRTAGLEGSDRLTFVTALAPDAAEASLEYAPLERILIATERSEDGNRQLMMRVGPFTMEEGDWQRDTVLLENVEFFRVRYWSDSRKEWLDEWDEEGKTPAAVQIGILLKGELAGSSLEEWKHQRTAQVYRPIELKDTFTPAGPATGSTNALANPVSAPAPP